MSRTETIKTVRKHQRKSVLDDNKTLMEAGLRASKQAVQQALDAGIVITYVENGELVHLDPSKQKPLRKAKVKGSGVKLRELLCQS